MGVTTMQQSQSLDKQSSKDLLQGGRRSSRSGSSSNSPASSQPSNANAIKKTPPPSKLASQLRKLRKRSGNNNNNNQTVRNTSSSSGKEGKKERSHAGGEESKNKNIERTPEIKRKHQKTGTKNVGGEEACVQQQKDKRLDGITHQGKTDNKTDLKQCSTSSSSNKTSTSNSTSNSNNNIKNRPPVKLTVKFNKSEGGGKKPCQVHVVNSSLSVLPTISSKLATSFATNSESTPATSTPAKINDTNAGTSINKTIEEAEMAAPKPANPSPPALSPTENKKGTDAVVPQINSNLCKIEKMETDQEEEGCKGSTKIVASISRSSSPTPLSVQMSSTDLVKAVEAMGFNDGNISTSLYSKLGTGGPQVHAEVPLRKEEVSPATPCVFVKSKEEAFSPQLFGMLLQVPIAVVRNLCSKDVCDLDLGLFSTKTLTELHPNHPIEIRSQVEQCSDENWDEKFEKEVWYCTSTRSHTTLGKYAEYQAGSLLEAYTEAEKSGKKFEVNPTLPFAMDPHASRRMLKFGTNLDISDERKWRRQLDELTKLPSWARVVSATNMLSHIGHQILGMNTVQLYMKVPCCRTPGHQENNNFCAVNMNIGPGDSEWFGVPDKYWSGLQQICKKNNVDYLHGSWWANVRELREAGIPVYRFMQKPGDLVWINTGCVHWVQAAGWCNNIAWNVGPLTACQYKAAMERYEWNKTQRYQSIVAMCFLSWNLARNIQVSDPILYNDIRTTLQQSIRQIVQTLNFVRAKGCKVRFHGHRQHESANYCGICDEEVFNVLLIRDCEKRHVVHCLKCARSPIIGGHEMKGIIALVEYPLKELLEVYDNFKLSETRPASNEP